VLLILNDLEMWLASHNTLSNTKTKTQEGLKIPLKKLPIKYVRQRIIPLHQIFVNTCRIYIILIVSFIEEHAIYLFDILETLT